MPDILKWGVLLASALGLTGVTFAQSDDELIIVNAPREIERTANNTVELTGVRALSSSLYPGKLIAPSDAESDQYFVPEPVLVSAWLTDPQFVAALKSAGLDENSNLSIRKIQEKGIDIQKIAWADVGKDYRSAYPLSLEAVGGTTAGTFIDATGFKAMTEFGSFNLDRTYSAFLGDKQVAMVGFNTKTSRAVFDIYSGMEDYADRSLFDPSLRGKSPASLLMNVASRYPIDIDPIKALTVSMGDASFGESVVKSSKQMKLTIDDAISSKNDVYIVEFTVTMRDVPEDTLEEMSFEFDCKEKCTAWELAPFRVSTVEKVEDTKRVPQISVNGITVGEVFSRRVAYEIIKPEVTAYGLREDRFSWSLQGQAMREGSHTFLAAIGVPKNVKSLEVSRNVSAKTKTTVAGFEIESNFAKSSEYVETLVFKRN